MTAKKTILDLATLEYLKKEAQKKQKKAQKIFDKDDDTDAMHESEQWIDTIHWLDSHIEQQEKKNT